MYIRSILGGQTPDLDVDDIAKIIKTDFGGTRLDYVKKLNTDKAVLRAVPSVEFDVEYKSHKLSEIEDEIQANRPVIAWIVLSEGDHRYTHSIVITGIDDELGRIYYNDPIFGKREEDISTFISQWEDADRILVKIKIGERIQRLLDEYVQKEETTNTD